MPNVIDDDVFNIRANCYFIAQAAATCAQCDLATQLIAVGVPPGHEVLELADDGPHDVGGVDTWATVDHAALLFHVAHLAEPVGSRMCAMSAAYRQMTDEPGVDSCWANHCVHCGAPFDDQDLFCEPGGAFLPIGEAAARRIRMVIVKEALAADAAGYVQDPEFFASLPRN